MKKIIFIIIIFLITFLIYYFNISEKIYYVSIGDYLSYGMNNFNKVENNYSDNIKEYYDNNLENYVNYSYYDDYRVMDLVNDINYNKIITYNEKEYTLQNLLIKANLLTISIGMNDIIYKNNLNNSLTYDYIDELLLDIENLLVLIRKYNKDDIYFLSFYDVINNKNIIEYANKRLNNICQNNDIKFVDISNLNNYIFEGTYPTNDGYTYITENILNFTK